LGGTTGKKLEKNSKIKKKGGSLALKLVKKRAFRGGKTGELEGGKREAGLGSGGFFYRRKVPRTGNGWGSKPFFMRGAQKKGCEQTSSC